MTELVSEMPSIALLCRRYRNKVLCVHQVHNSVGVACTYERGKPISLFYGAASRIILAHLSSVHLGASLQEVREILKAIRQRDGFRLPQAVGDLSIFLPVLG